VQPPREPTVCFSLFNIAVLGTKMQRYKRPFEQPAANGSFESKLTDAALSLNAYFERAVIIYAVEQWQTEL
jgi:hypothetical protein